MQHDEKLFFKNLLFYHNSWLNNAKKKTIFCIWLVQSMTQKVRLNVTASLITPKQV